MNSPTGFNVILEHEHFPHCRRRSRRRQFDKEVQPVPGSKVGEPGLDSYQWCHQNLSVFCVFGFLKIINLRWYPSWGLLL